MELQRIHTIGIHDTYTTPIEVWRKLAQFIPNDKVIWESAYCDGSSGDVWRELGYNTIHEDLDYFKWEPENYDIQITNPPFSIKKEWLQRAIELDKPFVLIMPESVLTTKYLRDILTDVKKLQLIVTRRMNFEKVDDGVKTLTTGACFGCHFYCYGLNLEQDLIIID